jgi:carbohydrate diacid regulator
MIFFLSIISFTFISRNTDGVTGSPRKSHRNRLGVFNNILVNGEFMMNVLTRELAQSIVTRTMKIIHRNINVMDHKGMIIGSGDPSRIGQIHDGAVQVIEKRGRIAIVEDQAKALKGTKPGVNLAIMFQGEIAGVIGITGPPDEVEKYSELVKMGAELTLEQAFLTEQIQWEERLKEDMINQIILGNPFEDSLFKERARRIAIDLTVNRIAIVVGISSASPKSFELEFQKIWSNIHSQLAVFLQKEDLVARISPYELVILKTVIPQQGSVNLAYLKQVMEEILNRMSALQLTCKAALGKFYPNIEEMKYSYETAKATLKVGEVLSPTTSSYLYQDYAFPVLVSDIQLTDKHRELVDRYEGLVHHDTKGELLETLQSYVHENGDVTKTANRLFIHRNTLGYRLNRITELTKRDPRKIQDLLELYTAMLLSKIK